MRTAALYLTLGSAATILFSIAASQILLALALVALLASDIRLRLPPIALPLGLFLLGTLISLALSPDPSRGLVQVRKVFVYTILIACYSAVREITTLRRLMQAWAVVGGLVAVRGLVQFGSRWTEARAHGADFYQDYVGQRISGFMGHWMTFGSQEMYVALMLAAFLLFSSHARNRRWIWGLMAIVLLAAIVLGFTRSIWIALATGLVYLVWNRRRVWVLALPAVAAAGFLLAPASVRSRATSILQPGKADSNLHRVVTWRTGIEMVKAHPWFGLGPEFVRIEFDQYVPADIVRPLPTGWYGHLHNVYLHYAAERGIPTMLMLLWMFARMLVDYWRALGALPPEQNDRRFLLHGAIAVVIATMIVGLFELNLGDSEVLTMFLVAASAGYVAAEPEEQNA
ncbi:MAG: O-antigen ligase family protein [Bryobacteraceae bacterium]